MSIILGFIGTGNMGSALIKGTLSSKKFDAGNIYIYDVDKNKTEILHKETGVNISKSISEIVGKSNIIILAVKPNNIETTLLDCKDRFIAGKILVSVAAGIPIKRYKNILGDDKKIIRVMPNTPALVREGMTLLSPCNNVTEEELKTVIDVLFQKEIMKNLIFSLGFKNIKVINDAFLGIKAGSPDGIGICLVNGTGNTVAGIDKNGKHLQVGGTGYFFGDEGGGFHMAGMTIRAVHEELFRCGKKTMITPRLLSILGVSDDKYFVDRVYDVFFSRILDPKEILRIMFNCANNGDEVAIEIVNRTSKEMAKSVCGCMRRLNFGYKVDIVLVGSINLKAETPLLLERLAFEISKLTDQKCNFIKLLVPPVYGAILWAHELAYGHPLSNKAKENILNQLKLG